MRQRFLSTLLVIFVLATAAYMTRRVRAAGRRMPERVGTRSYNLEELLEDALLSGTESWTASQIFSICAAVA